MSKGRVAWNVVTSATDLEAQNAGLDELPPKDKRYNRADEVLEACFALWNSWDADAFVGDKQAGVLAETRPRSTTPTTGAAGSSRAARCLSRAARRAAPPSCRQAAPTAGASSRRARQRRCSPSSAARRDARLPRRPEIPPGRPRPRAARVRRPPRSHDGAGRNAVDRAGAGGLPQQPDRPGAEPGCDLQQHRRGPDPAYARHHAGAVAGQPGDAGHERPAGQCSKPRPATASW
jgi:hypothetical protein